jgi:tetratricopeptide (TPR) repeat protein
MKNRIRTFAPWMVLTLLAGGIHAVQRSMDRYRTVHFVDTRPVFLPNGRLLRWMSMGYPGSVGDVLWIRSVLYYGRRIQEDENPYFLYSQKMGTLGKELERVRRPAELVLPANPGLEALRERLFNGFQSRGLVDFIYPLLDRVTTVDPHFEAPYVFGGVYVLMDTGDLDEAEALLQKGLRQNPESWLIAFHLGWYYWMYRGDTERCRTCLERAVSLPGCKDYVFSLLQGVTARAGAVDLTIQYLEGLLESTDNPDMKAKIGRTLETLKAASK